VIVLFLPLQRGINIYMNYPSTVCPAFPAKLLSFNLAGIILIIHVQPVLPFNVLYFLDACHLTCPSADSSQNPVCLVHMSKVLYLWYACHLTCPSADSSQNPVCLVHMSKVLYLLYACHLTCPSAYSCLPCTESCLPCTYVQGAVPLVCLPPDLPFC
jgi:hypothetical protein